MCRIIISLFGAFKVENRGYDGNHIDEAKKMSFFFKRRFKNSIKSMCHE